MPGGQNQLSQTGFRGRNDDGGEISATFIVPVNTDWEQRPDRNFRVRLLIENSSGFSGRMFLHYLLNGMGDWILITTSTNVIRATPNVNYADGDDTTQQIGSGVFASNPGMVENDGVSEIIAFPGVTTEEIEVEWSLEIVGNDVSDRDTIQLRGQFGSVAFSNGYFEIPEITVDISRTIRRTIIIE